MKILSNKQHTQVGVVKVENELSFFIENFNEAILIGKPDGTILNFNEAAVALFGYNLQEFKNIRRENIFDVTDKKLISAIIKREEKGYVNIELTGIKKNGDCFLCKVSSKVYQTTNGELRTSTVLTDISNKKKVEDDLSLIENLSEESFAVTDKTLKLTVFNKQYLDRCKFNLNINVVKGASILDYGNPARRKQMEEIYNKVLKGETIQTEIDIFSKNKNKETRLKTIKPVLDEKGNVMGTFTSSINITKQKKEQQAKIAMEHKFSSIVNSTSDLISLVDEVGNFLFINKTIENITGFTLDEIKGKPWDSLFHPDDKANAKFIFEDLLKKPGEASPRKIRILHKNGHYIWVEGTVTNLLNNINVKAIVSTCRDVTEQKTVSDKLQKSEEKLKENLDQLQLLTNNIDAVVYQFEMSPDGKMTLPFMSDSVHNLIPNLDLELLKQDASPAFAFVHSDDINGLIESIYESRNNLTDWNFEYRQKTSDGKEKWVKGSSKPTKKDDGTVVWYGYLLDITDRIVGEQKLKESNQRYDIIAKATNDTIWDRDLLTDKITWNKGIQGIYGYKENEPGIGDGCDWWESKIHPDDIDLVKKKLEARITNKILRWGHEYRFLCANNTYKYVFDRGFLVLDANERPIRMIGAMQDITNQKEEELHLKLLESVITHTTDSVIITKTNTDINDQIIIYVNTILVIFIFRISYFRKCL